MGSEAELLQVGDTVSFYNDRDGFPGYLTCDGFADKNMRFTRAKKMSLPKFEDAVFEVHVFKTYGSQQLFDQLMERNSTYKDVQDRTSSKLSGDEKAVKQEMKEKAAQVLKDRKANELVQARSRGKKVKYGQVIELKHVKSGGFLSVQPDRVAEGNREALNLSVSKENERCWFKIMPRFKLHAEGEVIHSHDQITLVNVKTHHAVHIDHTFGGDDPNVCEANAFVGHESIGLTVIHYAPFVDPEETDLLLNGGEVVRLYNKEQDGYVVVEDVDSSGEADAIVPHLHADRSAAESSNALFAIEKLDNYNGAFIDYKECVRFKHLGTMAYLCIRDIRDGQDTAAATGEGHRDIIRNGSANAAALVAEAFAKEVEKDQTMSQFDGEEMGTGLQANYRLELVEPAEVPDKGAATIFRIESFYKLEGDIPADTTFHIYSDFAQSYVSISEVAYPDVNDDYQANSGGMVGVVQKISPRLMIQQRSRRMDEDTLVMVRVDNQEMTNLNNVMGIMPLLRHYTETFEGGKMPSAAITKRVSLVLTNLVFFIQNVDPLTGDYDPLKVDGILDARKQKVGKEQGLLDLLLDLLASPFPKDIEGGGGPPKGRTSKHLMTLKQIQKDKKLSKYYHVCKLSYRLIKQLIKDNEPNRSYMSNGTKLDFMQSQLGYGLKTADTLMELFTDNEGLLNTITEDNVYVFVNLIKGPGKKERYMNFINALVTCNGKGFPRNQDLVSKIILQKEYEYCCIHMKSLGKDLKVNMASCEALADGKRAAEEWVTMSEFLEKVPDEQLAYFEKQLLLYANLCLGRNQDAMQVVREFLSFEVCFAIASDGNLVDRFFPIRAVFMKLIRVLYVDTDPHEIKAVTNLTRMWGKFDAGLPTNKAARTKSGRAPAASSLKKTASKRFMGRVRGGEFAGDTDRTINEYEMEEMGTLSDVTQVISLKKYLEKQVDTAHQMTAENLLSNKFILSCIRCMTDVVRFGWYASVDELEAIIEPLLECLDGRDDTQHKGDDPNDEQVIKARYTVTSDTRVIMDCKVAVIELFEAMDELRLDYRLGLVLKQFEKGVKNDDGKSRRGSLGEAQENLQAQIEAVQSAMDAQGMDKRSRIRAFSDFKDKGTSGGDRFFFKSNDGDGLGQVLMEKGRKVKMGGAYVRNGYVMLGDRVLGVLEADPELEKVFQTISMSSANASFVDVLLDCSRYNYAPLTSKAFGMLVRNFTQRLTTLRSLEQMQILVTKEAGETFQNAKRHNKRISDNIKFSMSTEEEALVLESLQFMEKVCLDDKKRPSETNQMILASLRADDTVHRVLRLPFANDLPREQGRRDIFLCCYRVLKNFCLDCPPNQERLLPHVPLYMSMMGVNLKAANTITAIFQKNRQVCSQIEPSTVRHFTKIIADNKQFPRYCKFLHVIVKPEGKPIVRNQELVTKSMMEKADDTMKLFNTAELQAERIRLMAEQDHIQNKEGILNYHLELIKLMSMLVEDKNDSTRSKLETLFTVDDAASQICEEGLLLQIRGALVGYFSETYLKQTRMFDKNQQPAVNKMVVTGLPILIQQCLDVDPSDTASILDGMKSAATAVHTYFSYSITRTAKQKWDVDGMTTLANLFLSAVTKLEAVLKSDQSTAELVNKATSACRESVVSNAISLDAVPTLVAQIKTTVELTQTQEARISARLNDYRLDYRKKTGLMDEDGSSNTEFLQLMEIFVDSRYQPTDDLPWQSPPDFQWAGSNLNVLNLVMHLVGLNRKGCTAEKQVCLKVLECVASFSDSELGVTREQSQERLDKIGEMEPDHDGRPRLSTMGGTRMVLRMINDENHADVLDGVLEVAIALADGGCQAVQDRIYDFFANSPKAISFFEKIQSLIRKGCLEITDVQEYHQKVREFKEANPDVASADVEKKLPRFVEVSHMALLLRFIQLTCEGHNRAIQETWHVQNNRRTYDIVSEVAEYLVAVHEAGIDAATIEYASATLECLTEMMQGPCRENQSVLASSKVPATCNKILMINEHEWEWDESGDILADFKEKCTVCLSAMLECIREPAVATTISNDIDMDNLYVILNEMYEVYLEEDSKGASADFDSVEEKLQTAFEVFGFLQSMNDQVPHLKPHMIHAVDEKAIEYYEKHSGSIEIVQDDEVRRIYFRLPGIFKRLSGAVKDALLWGVNRDSDTGRIEGFLEYADEIEATLIHIESLDDSILRVFTTPMFRYTMQQMTFQISILINALMLFTYDDKMESCVTDANETLVCESVFDESLRGPRSDGVGRNQVYVKLSDPLNGHGRWQLQLIWILGLVVCVIELMRYVGFFKLRSKMIMRKQFKASWISPFKDSDSSFEDVITGQEPGREKLLLYSVFFLMTDPEFVVNLAATVFTVMGVVYSPLYQALHCILHMVALSKDLQNVMLAITTNGSQLVVTAIFGIFISYIFAIWGFMMFQPHYVTEDGDRRCETLLQCTIITLNGGLRAGDVGEVLEDTEWPCEGDDCEGHSRWLLLFEFLYVCVFVVIMLNIIFGIIIDTFGELREIKGNTEEDIADKCFICGFHRTKFDRNEGGFEGHIKQEHYMWNYLFFMIHLNTKEEDDYTGPESYVKHMLESGEIEWIPIANAIALQDIFATEKREQEHLKTSIENNLKVSQQLLGLMQKLQESTDNISSRLPADETTL